MRIERRETRPVALVATAPVIAVLVAFVLAGLLIACAGAPVFESFRQIAIGAFGNKLSITETLTRATPLMLTGLAAAVAFRSRLWNIGAEGQFYMGALAVVAFGTQLQLPAPLLIPLLLIVGAIAGMIFLLIPLGFRLRFGVDEVVTTLLLNFIAVLFVSMMIEGPMKDPLAFGWPQSEPVPDAAVLPKIMAGMRLHIGIVIAIALALIIAYVQKRTVFGLETKAAGLNPRAARFAGVPLGKTLVKVACISGGLAGLAGAIQVMGVKGYVTTDLSPGFGYSGIIVAMLANLNPIGAIFSALFAAAMFVGADGMSRAIGIPSFIADVTVALSLLAMLVALFFTQYRIAR
ncbi:branched-chain amino acid transport system / permease component family protein [Ochrobactrum quorumnocens]|uniref:Branched-chain amino acid transport system / permease component family protein n=1 Tax=Ochrobactrum quorumnocens TaxID=271865 RepID=A0A248UC03_9HYPH|nr:ABC transporter permease [[Ochrobactrum] quorumnocens]ASV84255.1 branched-chain amino acid transport system / permease component family protein [[Ochrobactrum] quorumnocens]